MNITKNQWIVIAIVGAIAVWYFFLRKKDDAKESGYRGKLGPKSTTGTSGTSGLHLTCPAGRSLCSSGNEFKCCCIPGPSGQGCSGVATEPTVGV